MQGSKYIAALYQVNITVFINILVRNESFYNKWSCASVKMQIFAKVCKVLASDDNHVHNICFTSYEISTDFICVSYTVVAYYNVSLTLLMLSHTKKVTAAVAKHSCITELLSASKTDKTHWSQKVIGGPIGYVKQVNKTSPDKT